MACIMDVSMPGKNKYRVPSYGPGTGDAVDKKFLRTELQMPDVSEPEVIRHYTGLSKLNYGVDGGMYPLGSCTMKYNPKINERAASENGFLNIHPLAPAPACQGALRIIYELGAFLCAITGMSRFTMAPSAGAHGELTGVMIIKKYFQAKNEARPVIIIPDSAHGTNPATVAMCGFETREVKSTPEGDVDMQELKNMLGPEVAAMMLTSPNTLGLFDRNISEISKLLKANGSLFYADGANLNAVMGKARMSDMGFDMMHVNLHKTFSTPHGGGGPGSGPLGVREDLEQFLPGPLVAKNGDEFQVEAGGPFSAGRVHSFYGNFLVMVKAWVYIRMLGADGLREASETAVLNANYLMSILREHYNLPVKRTCMHEFVINDEGIENHISTNDISKRILDYGYHAPTVYFPLIIPGAMMIEPTETESPETLDAFARTMIEIRRECAENPELVLNAPSSTPVRRVDAVTAARNPVLTWKR